MLHELYTTIYFRNVGLECIETDKYQNTIEKHVKGNSTLH